MLPLLPLLPALLACQADLSGDWDGDFTCPEFTADLEVELDDDGDGSFTGELAMAIEEVREQDGTTWEYVVDAALDLELQVAGPGEQDLAYDAEWVSADCEGYVDGTLAYISCAEVHFPAEPGTDADFGDLTWDGGDRIEIDVEDCEGELER